MSTFQCPFCKTVYAEGAQTCQEYTVPPEGYDLFFGINPREYLRLLAHRCPECKHFTIDAIKETGEMDHFSCRVYPATVVRELPDYIPRAIREDYAEAQKIVELSPKAAATLCRRCLQGMIRDYWGIQRNRLVDEVNALENIVPPLQWKAINALKDLGNIGAHMEKDVSVIIDVSTEEAKMLLELIGNLIENWYMARHREEELYKHITDCAISKKQQM